MAVRNFWIDADIDGRQTELSGGPRGKKDGLRMNLYQREDGCIANNGCPVLKIYSYESEGVLYTEVFDAEGNNIKTIRTVR